MSKVSIEIIIDQSPGQHWSQCCSIAVGTNIAELLQGPWLQDLLSDYHKENYGVYAKKVDSNYVLQDGDRLEFYRPLLVGPKEARRLRAKKQLQNK